MKSKLIPVMLLAALATILTGCASQRADGFFPEGTAAKARYTRTGKFSTTTVEVDNFAKTPERVTADRLTFKHSNPWISNLELTLEKYERRRAPDEKDNPSTPAH